MKNSDSEFGPVDSVDLRSNQNLLNCSKLLKAVSWVSGIWKQILTYL